MYLPPKLNRSVEAVYIKFAHQVQRPIWLRVIYFVFIGIWFGLLWSVADWFLTVILITFPLGIWMLNRVGAVTMLLRY